MALCPSPPCASRWPCLIIVGSFSILAYNLDVMVQDLNQTSEILVYVDSDLVRCRGQEHRHENQCI